MHITALRSAHDLQSGAIFKCQKEGPKTRFCIMVSAVGCCTKIRGKEILGLFQIRDVHCYVFDFHAIDYPFNTAILQHSICDHTHIGRDGCFFLCHYTTPQTGTDIIPPLTQSAVRTVQTFPHIEIEHPCHSNPHSRP